jgi:hypothetical protein
MKSSSGVDEGGDGVVVVAPPGGVAGGEISTPLLQRWLGRGCFSIIIPTFVGTEMR